VADGIDDGRVSRNSGGEANVEAALALLSPWLRRRRRALGSSVKAPG
jgi:hypothetical protein